MATSIRYTQRRNYWEDQKCINSGLDILDDVLRVSDTTLRTLLQNWKTNETRESQEEFYSCDEDADCDAFENGVKYDTDIPLGLVFLGLTTY